MAQPFYNTINLNHPQLLHVEFEAQVLEELIKKIFQANPRVAMSPSQVFKVVQEDFKKKYPLTSIRRAMTNLSDPGYGRVLEKTDAFVMGLYGKPEHLWKLRITPKSSAPVASQTKLFSDEV